MPTSLNGKTIAFLVVPEGVEQAGGTAEWVSSRKPDDLRAFCNTLVGAFARDKS